MAQREGPLFLHNIEGLVLPEVGVAAVQVDEFARHVFTLLWGLTMREVGCDDGG